MKKRIYDFLVNRLLVKGRGSNYLNENESNRVEWIKSQLGQLDSGIRLLDAGAGEQRYRPDCDHLNYVAQDFAQYDGKGNEEGLQMDKWDYGKLDIVGDITNIPEDDDSFDAILCSEVFEHIPEPVRALEEFSRLLKTKGKLILTAPFNSLTHFAPYHYSTGFSNYFYKHHLEKFGFDIVELQYNGNYFQYLAQELARLPSIADQFSNDYLDSKERAAQKILMQAIDRFNNKDNGSQELLCFGIHILAEKL